MDVGTILRTVLNMGEKERKEVMKTIEAIEKVQGEIEALRQQISGKQDRISKLIESLPEELRTVYKTAKAKTGKRSKSKYTVTTPDGRITTVKGAYYEIYPDRQGKSYKYEDMIKALEENGYKVEIEE